MVPHRGSPGCSGRRLSAHAKQRRPYQQCQVPQYRWAGYYDYATCNLSLTSHCPVLNSGHFIWTTLNWVPCFLVFPRSRFEASIAVCQPCQLVSARVLDDFRGNSCFVIFNVTRAILEILLSDMHLVALWSQRAAVKSRHTQQRFVLWSRRLHELANPWKRFKCLVMFFEPMSREVLEPTFFPCCVVRCFASARGRVWLVSRLCKRPWFPVSARDVVGPDSVRSIVAQIEKCNQVLRYSFNPCFQPARVILFVFPSVPWLRSVALVCARIPHDVSSHLAHDP